MTLLRSCLYGRVSFSIWRNRKPPLLTLNWKRLQSTSALKASKKSAADAVDTSSTPTVHGEVVLRPYQEACIQSCLDALSAGYTRIGVSSPTGSGKTTIFLSLLSQLLPSKARPKATRALVIVNSVELVQQTAKAAETMFPDWFVEVEQGKHGATGAADLTIATYQTLLRPERRDKFDPSRLKAVIVDEAHHAAAPSYHAILSHFDPTIVSDPWSRESGEEAEVEAVEDHLRLEPAPKAEEGKEAKVPIIGFSATFSRHDGLALGKVFEQIVYHRDFLEMIKEQWLCNVRFTMVHATLGLSHVKVSTVTGDFSPTSLAHVINTKVINELIVKTWLDRASDRKSTLIFCVDLTHVADLTSAFRSAGVDARSIHSKLPALQRKELLAAFRAQEFPVLINCAVLIEGADMPNTDCVMLCRPTRSRNLFAQMIGRGMRLSPKTGKKDCRIVDFVDSVTRVSGVVNVPTLFGLNPSLDIQDSSLEELEEEKLREEHDGPNGFADARIPDPVEVTYVDYDDPFELAAEAAGSPIINRLSSNAWVCCGKDTWVLECLTKGFIKIVPWVSEDGKERGFEGWYTGTVPNHVGGSEAPDYQSGYLNPYRPRQSIFRAEDIETAIRAADTYVGKHVLRGSLALLAMRSASWRKQSATSGQKNFLAKRLKRPVEKLQELGAEPELISKLEAREKILEKLTKGQAANMISRLKHGAQSNWQSRIKKEIKQRQRVSEKEQKEAQRIKKHDVKVGPLPT